MCLIMDLICVSLIVSYGKHLFKGLFAIRIFLGDLAVQDLLFFKEALPIFKLGCLFTYCKDERVLYILWLQILCQLFALQSFPKNVPCLFIYIAVSFTVYFNFTFL